MAYPESLVKAAARGETIDGSKIDLRDVDSAIEHRMASLLVAAAVAQEDIPVDVLAALTAFDMAVAVRRKEQDRVFQLVHDRLSSAGVVHTFVKGPASARRWFAHPSQRPYSDIDVVVPKGPSFRSALSVLSPSHPALALSVGEDGIGFLSSVDLVVDGVRVDLHADALQTGLDPRRSDDWSVGTDLLGGDVRVLDPEHDLIVFLLHQGRDRFRFVLGLAETRFRLRRPIDWDLVEALARREGIWDQVAVALEVMCEELQVDSPVMPPNGWRTAMWRRLWNPSVRFLGELGRIRHIIRGRWLMPLTIRGRSSEAVRWMIRSIFPPDPVMRLRYPNASGPYLWRVVFRRARIIGRRRYSAWRNQRP
jgi:hypothetical protein